MENSTIIIIALALIALGILQRALGGSRRAASAETIKAHLAQGAPVIDVRGPEEYEMDHYPGARNIPLPVIAQRADELEGKDNPVVLYCNSGARCAVAVAQLRKKGYRNVVNAGGLQQLRRIGR
jgi:phage shock protein E